MSTTVTADPATPGTSEPMLSPGAMARARRRRAFLEFCREFSQYRAGMIGLVFLLIVTVLALLAPVIAPAWMLDVTQIVNPERFAPPSAAHPFGTDNQGRELWGRMIWGARASLLVGFAATIVSMGIGTLVGLAAGHFTGWLQAIVMRIIDFFLVFPSLILAIVLSSVLDRGTLTIIIALSVASWSGTARIVRAQVLAVEARDYVERSRALGAGHWHIMTKHLLPAVMPLVLASTTLTIGSAIIAESTLAFLGLGDPLTPSWGTILKNATDSSSASNGYWWYILLPGLAILFVVLAFTLIGRAVEKILNPTLRSR